MSALYDVLSLSLVTLHVSSRNQNIWTDPTFQENAG